MNPPVSIIVPIYNAEKYIQECIDSILSQTYKDFELILVVDGSKDNSANICDNNSIKDSRIRVIRQSNQGATAARRNGLDIANGEWIHFVDADDTLPKNALANLVEGKDIYDTDFVVGHFGDVPKGPPTEIPLEKWREYCISGEYILPGPVARLIRKSLFNDWTLNIPRNIVKGEDMLMNIRLSFNMTKNPIEVHYKVYNYRQNPESCVHTFIQDAAYEEYYHKLRLLSIPSSFRSRYLKASVHKRLLMLNEIYMNNPLDTRWVDSQFHNDLLDDIKLSSYHIKLKQWLIIRRCSNTLYRKSLNLFVKWDEKIYGFKCRIKSTIKRIIIPFIKQQ